MSTLESLPQIHPQVWPEISSTAEQIKLEVDPAWLENEIRGDKILEELWRNVQRYAIEYTGVVCEYLEDQLKGDDRGALEDMQIKDEMRRRKHVAFIDSLRILARNMNERGKDAGWHEVFGENRIKKGLWAIRFTYDKIIDNVNQEGKNVGNGPA